VDWIDPAQDREQLLVLVNAVLNETLDFHGIEDLCHGLMGYYKV
jgi:hypothetical protein